MKQAPEKLGTMKGLEMKLEVETLLQNKRYLIVLDDVQNLDKWQACRRAFPKNNFGSRVIITTQSGDVTCESQHPVYDLKPLSENESRDLFCLKAFGGKACPGHLVRVCDDILKKCAGLPLGIVAIGGMLRGKNPTVAEWDKINNSLGTELQGNRSLGSMHKILLRSYHDMLHDMKPCLLYMSIFPGDHLTEHNKLIRLWVAEGFVARDGKRTADDVAETYLSELLSRSLIQVAARRSDGRVKSYRIHGLTREILMMKSKAQNFAATSDKATSSYSKARRLLVQKDCVNLCGTLKKLRSLHLLEVQEQLTKSTMPLLFNKGELKLLTVLDLQGAKMDKFPSAITDLLNLRYLSLRDTGVKNIPNSIGRLRKLETLDLKRTRVHKLPNQIKYLRQLQNLLLYQYYDDKNGAFPSKHGFQAPMGIGELKSLQKLCFIEAGKDSGCIVNELGNLTLMRRLGIIRLSRNLVGALWSSIEKMSRLRALSVTASKGETVDLQGLGSPPPCLERLYLTGALVSFPQWIELPELQNLVKIFLKSSNLDHDSLAKLGELRNLLHIELQQVYDGKHLCFGRDKFKKLKILGLRRLESLETVTIEQNSMPCLEKFQIQECGCLATVPLGIEQLFKLRVLDLVDMPEEMYARIQPYNVHGNPVQGDDYWRIQHISGVCFIKKEDNVWIPRRVSTVMRNLSASDKRSDDQLDKEINHFGKKLNFRD
uniref:NB-ARC domain-containing protein n=1 Tax=Kalanchoe fedtschenkoi TaxID=63787 RepID=A0A7N1A3H9_KALFE